MPRTKGEEYEWSIVGEQLARAVVCGQLEMKERNKVFVLKNTFIHR